MTIKQTGGIFGRKPTFSEVTASTFNGDLIGDVTGDITGNVVSGGVVGATKSFSYPTDNVAINLLTLTAQNVARVGIIFTDGGYRQGIWAGEVVFFVSDAAGSPALQGNVIEIYNQVGSASWVSPVVTISNSTNTLTFNATSANNSMTGTVYVYVYHCTDYNDLTFA